MFWWLLASVLVAEIILYEEKLKLYRGCFFFCAHFFVGYWWIVVVVNKSISTNYQRLIYFWKTVKWFSWSSCLLISN